MEGMPDDPSVTEALKKLNERIGRDVACPCCGGTDWKHARDVISNVGVFVHEEADPLGEDPDSGFANVRLLLMVCANCAFIRQHFVGE